MEVLVILLNPKLQTVMSHSVYSSITLKKSHFPLVAAIKFATPYINISDTEFSTIYRRQTFRRPHIQPTY